MTPPQEPRMGDNVIGQCSKCGRAWLAGHVCGEMSERSRAALDDVVTASIAAAKRLFPDEKGEPVVVMHAAGQEPRTGGDVADVVVDWVCRGCGGLIQEGHRPGCRFGPQDAPSPESLGITHDHDGWFTEYIAAVKDAS